MDDLAAAGLGVQVAHLEQVTAHGSTTRTRSPSTTTG